VCVREKERTKERERERKREKARHTKQKQKDYTVGAYMCACVHICEKIKAVLPTQRQQHREIGSESAQKSKPPN